MDGEGLVLGWEVVKDAIVSRWNYETRYDGDAGRGRFEVPQMTDVRRRG